MKICPTCGNENPDNATTCTACGAPLNQQEQEASVQHLSIGTKLRGEAYTIEKVLGQGGFGITYLGSNKQDGKVAIKEFFLQSYCIRQGTAVQATTKDYQSHKNKFLEEAQLLSEFQHSSIVRVFTWFEENNSAYMIMEYVEGRTLLKLLEERNKPLLESEAVNYVIAVSEALRIVHQANVLHRDIKPDNIMVTNDSRVVLIDFGAARDFIANKTQTHSAIFTPGYAPLEQYGEKSKRGPYTDIYALGATLYHLLTGEPPAPATERTQGLELIPPCNHHNAEVSRKVSDAVMYAIEMRVGDRPQTVDEFILVLRGQKASPKPVVIASNTLRFDGSEQASSIPELIVLCDKYISKAQDFLFNRYFESWLAGSLGRTDLAQQTHAITDSYDRERPKGLELFVRLLCNDAGVDTYPKIFAQPSRLNLGEISIGAKRTLPLKLGSKGRGFAWGLITIQSPLPGLRFPDVFKASNETLYIELDTLEVKPGKYQSDLIIQADQVPSKFRCVVPIEYTVKPLVVNIEPKEINLGNLPYGKQSRTSFKVVCEPNDGRIKGTISSDLTGVEVTKQSIQSYPNSSSNWQLFLEGSSLDLHVFVNTKLLEAGRKYCGDLSLQTNVGTFKIPTYFKVTTKYDVIAYSVLKFGGFVGVAMGTIRGIVAITSPRLAQFLIEYENFRGLGQGWTEPQIQCGILGFLFSLIFIFALWIVPKLRIKKSKSS